MAVGDIQTGKAILCPKIVVDKSLFDTSLKNRGLNLYLQGKKHNQKYQVVKVSPGGS